MCGIAALFGRQLTPKVANSIQPMTSLISHRGPDDEGFVFLGGGLQQPLVIGSNSTPENVYKAGLPYTPKNNRSTLNQDVKAALGHRRLSILDLSPAGHQPLCDSSQRFWITYNGEVYNYIEIRQELIEKGHYFKTQTDTEVILAAFQEWGVHCLEHFNGMFSFVIYDDKEKTFFAARDRFGVKPLYYWVSPDGFLAFASEIKQFTVLPGWKSVMNGQIVYDFLNWGTKDHTEETFFSDVRQLKGGEYLFFAVDNIGHQPLKPKQWYEIRPKPFQGDLEEGAKQLYSLLEDAIRLRLRADVDVGSCLSGGLDSSSIVCVANKLLRNLDAANRQMTFTACSDVQRFDETRFADLVINQTGVKAQYTTPNLNHLFEVCPELVWHQDEPFVSTSMYAQWSVFQLVKKHNVKVVLDGQGSDEQLGGYHGFFGNHFYDLFVKMRWKHLINEIEASKQMHPALQPYGLLFNKLTPEFLRQHLRKMLGKTSRHSGWFDIDLLRANGRDPLWNEPHRSVYHQSLQQLTRSSLPMLLHYEDRNSMAHSVESRTPFLDYRLVEFVLGLPSHFKISQGWTKQILRESMKNVLPEPVRTRIDKLGFVTAEEDWVRKDAPDKFRKAVQESFELSQGIFKPCTLNAVEDIIAGKKPFNFLIWRLISFGTWMKQFNVSLPN